MAVGRNLQEESWSRAEGSRRHPGLVGQVYFPFDSDKLDNRDAAVLSNLARRYRTILLGRRVELVFVGHADKRGSAAYNRRLGLRRACSAKRFFDRELGASRFNYYSSRDALSRGEMDAVRKGASAARMAQDRRVDIFSSYTPSRRIGMPPLRVEVARHVRRTNYREFVCTDGKDIGKVADPDRVGEVVDGLLDHWFKGTRSFYGREALGRRRTVTIPATYRVNHLQIDTRSASKFGFGYSVESSTTQVTYTWGPPRDSVSVVESTRTRQLNSGRVEVKRKVRRVSRSEADRDPMYFPPDPE